jgi:hypothetical protein
MCYRGFILPNNFNLQFYQLSHVTIKQWIFRWWRFDPPSLDAHWGCWIWGLRFVSNGHEGRSCVNWGKAGIIRWPNASSLSRQTGAVRRPRASILGRQAAFTVSLPLLCLTPCMGKAEQISCIGKARQRFENLCIGRVRQAKISV